MEGLNKDAIFLPLAESAAERLRQELDDKDKTYTGRAKESIKVNGYNVDGVRYVENLVFGVPPGTQIDYKSKDLQDWCVGKMGAPYAYRESAAWAVAKKTELEGSTIWRGDREPLDIAKVIEAGAAAFFESFKKEITRVVNED